MRATLTAHDTQQKTRVYSTTTSRVSAEGNSYLGQPKHKHGRPLSAPNTMPTRWGGMVGSDAMRDAQAGVPSAGWLRAQLAFKNSMVHGILQFTPSIAFRYVLHRCESRDIRCRESFVLTEQRASPRTIRERGARGRAVDCSIPWRFPRRGSLVARRACAPRATGGGARRASAAPGV